MDKRYLVIILIMSICAVNLYIISDNSDVVGSAYVNVGKYTFSLPNGFTMYSNEGNAVTIKNSDLNMTIYIQSSLGKSDSFSNRLHQIDKDGFELYSNGTVHCGDMEVPVAFYHKGSDNRSTFYFSEYGDNFRILIAGFDYNTQRDEVINIASDLIDSVRVNHKLSG